MKTWDAISEDEIMKIGFDEKIVKKITKHKVYFKFFHYFCIKF